MKILIIASSGMQIKSNGKLREITRDVQNEVNKSFKKKTGIKFNEALVKAKELKLTNKNQNFNENGSYDKSIASKRNSRGKAQINCSALFHIYFVFFGDNNVKTFLVFQMHLHGS